MHIKTLLSFLTISVLLSPLLAQTNSVDSAAGYLDTKISETCTQINNGLDDTSKLFTHFTEFDNTDLLYSSLLITGIAASF